MSESQISDELLCQIQRDRGVIAQELPELAERDAHVRGSGRGHAVDTCVKQSITSPAAR